MGILFEMNTTINRIRWTNIVALTICFGMLCLVALRRDGQLFGESITNTDKVEATTGATPHHTGATPILSLQDTIINTSNIPVATLGYKGAVPVKIYISAGRVDSIIPLENEETPSYFGKVTESGLLESWNGKTPEEGQQLQVDAVTGATYSSKAIIANVQAGLKAYNSTKTVIKTSAEGFATTWQWVAGLIVVLCGILLPLFLRNKWYRDIQLMLNIGVLGFLTGSFLSYSLIVRSLSQEMEWISSLVALLMMFAAFIMPLLGHSNHYCNWICPLGSAQELMGKLITKKPKIGIKTIKLITRLRDILWWVLMVAMWMGAWYDWMDYEPFSAFRIQEASVTVIIIGIIILLLSIFINRPYCRFVCPTGNLLRKAQKIE